VRRALILKEKNLVLEGLGEQENDKVASAPQTAFFGFYNQRVARAECY
jgi:hypothetical protein